MTARALRAVIVEDEPHARLSLREYVRDVEWLSVAGEATNGAEAAPLIDRLEPDLVFLDVSLPEASGIDVARRIRHRPEIVFTTAYDQYALAAFELGALDYLLKPFGPERFRAAMERVRQRMKSSVPAAERMQVAFDTPLRRLFARIGDAIVPIDVRTIRHISASGDYVEVHAGGETHLLHTSLRELAARLDPNVFQQVHRSHIVNLDAVAKFVPWDSRRLLIKLRDGTEIIASRTASEQLRLLAR